MLKHLQHTCSTHAAPVLDTSSAVASVRCQTHAVNGQDWPRLQTYAAPVQDEGFSEAMVTRFFQPFLGGIFFDRSLRVTSRLFTFVMRCLATGSNCLPARGIGAVADQMASRLPEGSVRTGQAYCLGSSLGAAAAAASLLLVLHQCGRACSTRCSSIMHVSSINSGRAALCLPWCHTLRQAVCVPAQPAGTLLWSGCGMAGCVAG